MENYYEVTKQSPLHKEYMDYIVSDKIMREISHEFLSNNNINTKEYASTKDTFYIIPNEKDIEDFGKLLNKELENGLRAFKAKSKIGKAWKDAFKEKGIQPLHKPMLMLYFNVYGETQSRLFAIEDKIYCSFKSEHNFENPEGFIELKASEFYKIVEDENERRKTKHENN